MARHTFTSFILTHYVRSISPKHGSALNTRSNDFIRALRWFLVQNNASRWSEDRHLYIVNLYFSFLLHHSTVVFMFTWRNRNCWEDSEETLLHHSHATILQVLECGMCTVCMCTRQAKSGGKKWSSWNWTNQIGECGPELYFATKRKCSNL